MRCHSLSFPIGRWLPVRFLSVGRREREETAPKIGFIFRCYRSHQAQVMGEAPSLQFFLSLFSLRNGGKRDVTALQDPRRKKGFEE